MEGEKYFDLESWLDNYNQEKKTKYKKSYIKKIFKNLLPKKKPIYKNNQASIGNGIKQFGDDLKYSNKIEITGESRTKGYFKEKIEISKKIYQFIFDSIGEGTIPKKRKTLKSMGLSWSNIRSAVFSGGKKIEELKNKLGIDDDQLKKIIGEQ